MFSRLNVETIRQVSV